MGPLTFGIERNEVAIHPSHTKTSRNHVVAWTIIGKMADFVSHAVLDKMSPSLKASTQLEKDRKEMVVRIFQAMETEGLRFQPDSHSYARSPSRNSTQSSIADSGSTSGGSRTSSSTTLSSISSDKMTLIDTYGAESSTDENLSTDSNESGDEDIVEDEYECPPSEWERITEYLWANRGPYQLGLDTMRWLPEPVFLRYILDRGGLDITPRQLRCFLAEANKRAVLFFWRPFPGMGTVKRVEDGWPYIARNFDIAPPAGPVKQEAMAFLEMAMGSRAFQKLCYARHGEMGDVDMQTAFNVRAFRDIFHWPHRAGIAHFTDLPEISANIH